MLKDQRTHTTLPAADLGRAKKFYADKLGLTPATESPGGLFYVTAGGTRFILYPTPNPTRAGHTQMGISVEDIEKTVSDLQGAGVAFEGSLVQGQRGQPHRHRPASGRRRPRVTHHLDTTEGLRSAQPLCLESESGPVSSSLAMPCGRR